MPGMRDIRSSVVIVGGGPAGLTLACVLASAGVDVVCIDRDAPTHQAAQKFDGRTTAISYASHRVMQAAGVWDAMLPHCAPILDIRVADGASPLYLHFDSTDDGADKPFGWIIENTLMRQALFARAKNLKKHLHHLAPVEIASFSNDANNAGVTLKDGRKVTAPLMIGADGRNSATRCWLGIEARTHDYGQTAIVCNVAHELDHENVALEHFLPAGPFAVLPMTDDRQGAHRSSIVWTEHGNDAASILKLSSADFDRRLQSMFGTQLGKARHVSAPMAYPLSLLHADTYIASRVALIAEAAHAIHPIAGQGLNLSMRDIAVLAELIVDRLRLGLDPGATALLSEYESLRRFDVMLMTSMTDLLNRLFSNDSPAIAAIRDLGLAAVEKTAPLKRYFASHAMGLSGRQVPRIIETGRL